MDDVRFGNTVRSVRMRQGMRQDDLAAATEVPRRSIALIEHGHMDSVRLGSIRRVCGALEIRVDMVPRWRGGDLDRMLSSRHAQLAESVVQALRGDSPEWQVVPEVSFSQWGERGVIDLLAWHPGRRALMVIELKTELVDVGEMLGTMDRKRRLAWSIARDRGWEPVSVSGWIILASGRTNERRVAAFRATLRAAYPEDGRRMRAWLHDPASSVAGLSIWPDRTSPGSKASPASLAARRRVRVPGPKARPAGRRLPSRVAASSVTAAPATAALATAALATVATAPTTSTAATTFTAAGSLGPGDRPGDGSLGRKSAKT